MTKPQQCFKFKKYITKAMFDLSSKYVNVYKVPPKKKKVDQSEKLKQKYKLGKYKYSLLNPDNVVFDSPNKIREKDFEE